MGWVREKVNKQFIVTYFKRKNEAVEFLDELAKSGWM